MSVLEMSDEVREETIARPEPMRFATYEPDGFPHVVPVWHVKLDDSLYFDTDKDSVKVRNVKKTGKGAGVMDAGTGYAELRGVLVQGEASLVEDEDTRSEVMLEVAEKFVDGEIPDFVRERNKSVERTTIELSIDHVTTWDFRNVFGTGTGGG
ncbi:MAG: pyridoxamine 5'-phosphate oxidase family protein [Halobacteria archaeon]|nr:pyridoxamine 5'-phosphate oxidase family protein [Halobacteria archaeon]